MLGCRTRTWCRNALPIGTAREDAREALAALAAGKLELSDRLLRQVEEQIPATQPT
jgi:cellobiose-specific phosphotransferase system component IIA